MPPATPSTPLVQQDPTFQPARVDQYSGGAHTAGCRPIPDPPHQHPAGGISFCSPSPHGTRYRRNTPRRGRISPRCRRGVHFRPLQRGVFSGALDISSGEVPVIGDRVRTGHFPGRSIGRRLRDCCALGQLGVSERERERPDVFVGGLGCRRLAVDTTTGAHFRGLRLVGRLNNRALDCFPSLNGLGPAPGHRS